ncbi:hypothetical protein ACJMK2_030616 [Sinanodonta woodiana]|uniref:Uncharacterized protein n=1 Tax=Sinanodonta woodiana TaxID=1069815 RepID=A0ABD3WXQ2_SINWO
MVEPKNDDSSCPQGGYNNAQPQFGPGCMYRCHCVDDVQCDNITGNCPKGCAAGWMGPGCQYVKLTSYEVRVGNYSSNLSLYIGDSCFKQIVTHWMDTSTDVMCTHEIVGRYILIKTPDNATTMTLCDVRVYGERLSGFSVSFATNSSFHLVYSHPMETPPLIMEIITLTENYAQHVQISLNNMNLVPLTLCEVFVFGDCQEDMCGWICDILCHCDGPIAKQNIIYASCTSGCKSGWWGHSCNNTCDSNCKDNTCNQRDGYCLECAQGKWGHLCDNDCTNCLHGTGCGVSDGICSVGCLTGYFGISCGEHCGHCAADGSCDRYTGACIHGCQPGWQEEHCTTACPAGLYGTTCSATCGHCANTSCDHINGTCPLGCTEGYYGTKCSEPCPAGLYSTNCSATCGHCAYTSCDHYNGTCPLGCSEGYNGTKCSERQEETSTESTSTLPIGIPVGGALGAAGLTLLIILFAIIYWKRRKRVPEACGIEHTYDQIDRSRALQEKLSAYSKIEELGLSPVIPKEITYENTLLKKNLIPTCEFRDNYQHYISLDDITGELRLLSLFNSIPSPAQSKTEVTRTGRGDDCIETLHKSYLFEANDMKIEDGEFFVRSEG